MSEKKMAGVFLLSTGGPPYGDTEKIKNENLIVVAQFDGIPFSRCVFPNSMRGQAFDPEYAERVADDEFYASGNLSRAHFAMENPVEEYDTEDYPWWAITPGGFNLLVLPLMLATPSLEVIAAVEKMRAENGGENWLAKMKTENTAEVEKKFGFDPGQIQNRWKDKGRGIPESTTMPEPVEVSSPEVSSPVVQSEYGCTAEEAMALHGQAMQILADRLGAELNRIAEESVGLRGAATAASEVSSPSPVSPLRPMYQLDTATGRVSIVAPESPEEAWKQVLQEGVVNRLLKQPSPASSDPEPKEFVQGFLRDTLGMNDEEIEALRELMGEMIRADVRKVVGKDESAAVASNSMPDDKPPAAAPDVLTPPGFVAVPLPDDGDPVLGYMRKPGHYLAFNGYFVDLTYNVGTGVGQIEGKFEFPWVHFDPFRRGLAWHVFYTPYGKAYSWNGTAGGRNQFCYLSDYDVVKKCVSVASDDPQDVQAAWEATVGPATATWEAPLADGDWFAQELTFSTDAGRTVFTWTCTGEKIRGIAKPAKLGRYQFKDGVGTLIEEARKEGSE